MSDTMRDDREPRVEMPAPTAWPLVTAFGVALAFAGLVTSAVLGVVGLALMFVGAVGGVREVLPAERRETMEVEPPPRLPAAARMPHRPGESRHRMRIPGRVHPYAAGLRGGVAGGVAMALVAVLYGVVDQGSPWLPINLLAAVAVPSLAGTGLEGLRAFHAAGFALACLVHGVVSAGVGLLYGVLLPMLPGPVTPWGVVIAPLLWSGVLRATLDLINPALAARIDWPWFVASQVAFGLVAGVVVARSHSIAVLQRLPLRERAGLRLGSGTDGGSNGSGEHR